MRSTTNCYIANMAVADLLVALVPMWIHVSTDVIDQDGWPLGSFLCKFNSFVQGEPFLQGEPFFQGDIFCSG